MKVKNLNFRLNEIKTILISLLILFIYLSPYIFKNDSKFLIGDNLNVRIPTTKVLIEGNYLFTENDYEVKEILGGIERGFLPSQYQFNFILYSIFSSENAYKTNRIFMHLIAFIGMFVLINKHFYKKNNIESRIFTPLIALGFATLPFFTNGNLSITGQPLLLFALLNFLKKEYNLISILIILLFPFFSSLVLANIFFFVSFCTFLIFYFIKKRYLNVPILLVITGFIIVSIFVEYRLFEMQFCNKLITSRREMYLPGVLNFKGLIGTSLLFFIKGHRHFASNHTLIILPFALLSLLFVSKKGRKILIFLLLTIYLISLFEKITDLEILNFIKQENNFLNSFTLRFFSLFPLLWYLVLIIIIKYFIVKIYKNKIIILVLIAVVINNILGTKDLYSENSFLHSYFINSSNTHISFNNYYSPKFFNLINKSLKEVDLKKEYIGCIGFEPGIMHFNGFKTIGGFQNNYSLDYKNKFRNIIKNEIARNSKLRNHFNNYGVQCYLFSSELFLNKKIKEIKNLYFEIDELKKIGCKYLLSTKPIKNVYSLELNFTKFKNKNKDAFIKNIYVYKI